MDVDNGCKGHPGGCWCNVARAFAMAALAMCSTRVLYNRTTRRWDDALSAASIEALHAYERLSVTAMEEAKAAKLREAGRIGQVTVLCEDPAPYRYLSLRGGYGEVRAVYGVWLERRASWAGKRAVPPPVMASRIDPRFADIMLPGEES